MSRRISFTKKEIDFVLYALDIFIADFPIEGAQRSDGSYKEDDETAKQIHKQAEKLELKLLKMKEQL